jgi:hypothetical protein
MLNEETNIVAIQLTIAIATILFLAVMWGGLWYFVKFKGKDLRYRGRVVEYFSVQETEGSETKPSE